MTQETDTPATTGNATNQVIIQRYNGEILPDVAYVVVGYYNGKVICEQCANENRKELKNALDDMVNKDRLSVFACTALPFDLRLSCNGLTVRECPAPLSATFNIKMQFRPDTDFAAFLLTHLREGTTNYTISDLQNHLMSDIWDMQGTLQSLLYSEELRVCLLEKHGKNAYDFIQVFSSTFPSFLQLKKINSAKFQTVDEQESDSISAEELQSYLKKMSEALAEKMAEERRKDDERGARILKKLQTRDAILEQMGLNQLNAGLRAEALDEQAIKNIQASLQRNLAEVRAADMIEELKFLRLRNRSKRIFSLLKWPLLLVIIVAGIWFGKQWQDERNKQQPELLIKIENYENCRKEFNEQIWPELSKFFEFDTPEIYEDVAIFRAQMDKETRSKVINYLQQCQRKRYIKLTSLKENDLPESPYDLVGYKLTMAKQSISMVRIIVEGSDPDHKVAQYILENWGVIDTLRHPDKENVVIYLTQTSFNDYIALKTTFVKDIEAIHPGAIVTDNVIERTVTISFIDDAIKTYKFDLRRIPAADKQAAISKILGGHPVVLGFITGKFRSTDMTEIKASLETAGFIIVEEAEKNGAITLVLQEKVPVFSHKLTVVSKVDPTPVFKSIKKSNDQIIDIICDYKKKTGPIYRCDLRVHSYLQETPKVMEIFENNKMDVFTLE